MGPKVRAFYRALNGEQVLVVDGHMINAWKGDLETPLTGVKLSASDRVQLLEDYHSAANLTGLTIREFQARVWNEQRARRANRLNSNQLTLGGV